MNPSVHSVRLHIKTTNSFIATLFIISGLFTSCGDDQTVAPKNAQYAAARADAKSSGKKGGEVSGETDMVNSVEPNGTSSNSSSTTSGSTGISTDSGTTSSITSITSTTTTSSTSATATWEGGQAYRMREDADMDIRIDLMGDTGNVIRSITLRDPDERKSEQLPEMCRKGGTTKWKVSFLKGHTKAKGDSCYFVVTNNASKVRLDVDMVGDDLGCKPGEDDQFEFTCNNSTIELQ